MFSGKVMKGLKFISLQADKQPEPEIVLDS